MARQTAVAERGTRQTTAAPDGLKAGEFRGRNGRILKFRGSDTNSFDVPEHLKEEGWTYQWQAWSIYGEPAPDLMDMLANGWDYVPADSDIGNYFSASNDASGHVVIRGLVLMERPKELTDMYVAEARSKTRDQYRDMMGKSTDIQLPSGFEGADKWNVKSVARERVNLNKEFGIGDKDAIPDED
jgi:hypothetical protein